MRLLITGSAGMLGQAATQEFLSRGDEVFGFDHKVLDVTRSDQVANILDAVKPDVVLQCAAYTSVDTAEAEPERAFEINGHGAAVVSNECQRRGAAFVYPSTDYVFSGRSAVAWKPGDRPDPINAYGRSKLAGEMAALSHDGALVVRTSWLYGSGGRNFVDTILRLSRERPKLEVVDDQIGMPTWTGSLAWIIAELLKKEARGIFHACDGGPPISWYEFAREILDRRGIGTPVVAVSSEMYPQAARRPRYSVLDCSETELLLGSDMPGRGGSLGTYLGRGNLR